MEYLENGIIDSNIDNFVITCSVFILRCRSVVLVFPGRTHLLCYKMNAICISILWTSKCLALLIGLKMAYEPGLEISNNVVCATCQASDQPAHTRSLIRAFASRLNIL